MAVVIRAPRQAGARSSGKGKKDGPGKGGERAKRKKMLFSGNELSHLLQINDLAVFKQQKRTAF
jgi:hypothetical protein